MSTCIEENLILPTKTSVDHQFCPENKTFGTNTVLRITSFKAVAECIETLEVPSSHKKHNSGYIISLREKHLPGKPFEVKPELSQAHKNHHLETQVPQYPGKELTLAGEGFIHFLVKISNNLEQLDRHNYEPEGTQKRKINSKSQENANSISSYL